MYIYIYIYVLLHVPLCREVQRETVGLSIGLSMPDSLSLGDWVSPLSLSPLFCVSLRLGRFLAELTREVIKELEDRRFQHVEWRVSIYGSHPEEWQRLAEWLVDSSLTSIRVRWLIQVPRYAVSVSVSLLTMILILITLIIIIIRIRMIIIIITIMIIIIIMMLRMRAIRSIMRMGMMVLLGMDSSIVFVLLSVAACVSVPLSPLSPFGSFSCLVYMFVCLFLYALFTGSDRVLSVYAFSVSSTLVPHTINVLSLVCFIAPSVSCPLCLLCFLVRVVSPLSAGVSFSYPTLNPPMPSLLSLISVSLVSLCVV